MVFLMFHCSNKFSADFLESFLKTTCEEICEQICEELEIQDKDKKRNE